MEDAITAAISSKKGVSRRKLAAAFDVPRSTLDHRLRGRRDRSRGHASQSALSEEEEDAIAAAVERLCYWHWAPSRACIRSMAEDVLRAREGLSAGNLGKRWPDRFLGRYPALRTTWSEALSNARAAAGLPETIRGWMSKLWARCDALQIGPGDLWNFDEKGVQAGGTYRKKVIVRRSRLCFDRQRRGPGDKDNVTLVESCSAEGKVIPPLIILHGTETQFDWVQSTTVPSDYKVTSTESGWSNSDLGFAWLSKIFEPNTYTGRPRVLVIDGHRSHLSWNFLSFAAEHDIALACLPPHTSHLLQPLDVGLFGPEGHWLSEELLRLSLASANAPTTREMIECIARARPRAFTERNIRSGWKKTGIWPRSLDTALSEVSDPRPSTPPHEEADPKVDLLRTPHSARHVDLHLDSLLDKLDLTPESLRSLNKLAKAAKQGRNDLILANKEIGDLRETADRQERRKERLPRSEGLILDFATARTLAEELRKKQEGKDLDKRRTVVRKRKLEELKKDGTVGSEAKRLPKRFYNLVEADLHNEGLISGQISTAEPTSSHEHSAIGNN